MLLFLDRNITYYLFTSLLTHLSTTAGRRAPEGCQRRERRRSPCSGVRLLATGAQMGPRARNSVSSWARVSAGRFSQSCSTRRSKEAVHSGPRERAGAKEPRKSIRSSGEARRSSAATQSSAWSSASASVLRCVQAAARPAIAPPPRLNSRKRPAARQREEGLTQRR